MCVEEQQSFLERERKNFKKKKKIFFEKKIPIKKKISKKNFKKKISKKKKLKIILSLSLIKSDSGNGAKSHSIENNMRIIEQLKSNKKLNILIMMH